MIYSVAFTRRTYTEWVFSLDKDCIFRIFLLLATYKQTWIACARRENSTEYIIIGDPFTKEWRFKKSAICPNIKLTRYIYVKKHTSIKTHFTQPTLSNHPYIYSNIFNFLQISFNPFQKLFSKLSHKKT